MLEVLQLNPHYTGLFLSLSAVMVALMSPGPNILAVIGTSMSVGRQEGIALALGVGFGTFLWVTLTVLGFTAIIASYAQVMFALKILGGAYLIWLGYKSFRSAASKKDISESAVLLEGGPWAYFRRGLIVQMTNPKAALAMIAIVSIGVHVNSPTWVGVALVCGATALSISAHLLYAVAFSTKSMVALYSRARCGIEAFFGAFFCYLGFRLLTSRQ